MAKEICISSTPHETRLAILEDDQLAEIYYERENEYTLAGSIYNGRVTRVLPGMQSAFVDLGLERDAFLYVTDFLEMEDPEDSDEVEKAAVTGGAQPPREINRTPQVEKAPRPEGRRERSDRPEQDRTPRERKPVAAEPVFEVVPVESTALEAPAGHGFAEGEGEEGGGDQGGKRWRGRRRRRGGRGPAASVSDPVETEASAETYSDPSAEPAVASELQASSHQASSHQAPSHEPQHYSPRETKPREAIAPSPREARSERQATPFVLPGESLSKYGGEPSATATPSASQPAAPARPAVTFRPSTLIEKPLEWDGSGLLPGESISRHRTRPPETTQDDSPSLQADTEPQGTLAAHPVEYIEYEETVESAPGHEAHSGEVMESAYLTPETSPLQSDDLVEEELVREEQPEEMLLGESVETEKPAVESDPFSDPFFSEMHQRAHGEARETHEEFEQEEHSGQAHGAREGDDNLGHEPIHQPSNEVVADAIHPQTGDPDKPEEDRTASHHVDPLPPSEFRLFGIGGKKKKSDEPAASEYPAPVNVPATEPVGAGAGSSVRSVSGFAPGTGLVEEETIEGEEFDAPRAHSRSDEHDLDDYEEEEKLQTQIRSGELGEMLQEAHLDHRIQMNFDDKNGDTAVDDEFDTEEEEEGSEEQTTADGAAPAGQQRRDRGGRGRRGGRPAQGGRGGDRRGGPSRRSAQTSDLPIISDLLKPGQEILVQIAKEPIAKKGARITSHIALPGRFLVFMPTVSHVGVSRKIASDEERQRLKRILVSERGESSGGFIVRTAAEGASEEELRADLRFLLHLWDEIKDRSEKSKSPALIYHDLSLIERILRDQVSANFSSIWVDSQDDYERIVRFLNRFSPNLVRRVKLYTKEVPLFEHFGIQDEISKALRSKVWLKSGGSIVINQTEALVAIDINTGKYVGKTARLEDTIVKTNLDAIPEIVRQIRLRDLGGIIIIDFIDMDERKNRFKVMAALEEALKNDRAPTKVLQFNDFGLVAITRKRVKQSLERTLSVPCPTCQATGMVKSPATVCNEIYIELRKMRKHFENADVMLRVNPETVKVLKGNNAHWLTEFEELIGKNILVKSDATLHPEQFDIQG
jgi:Rne/Rng family ribonuclease